MSKTTRGTQSFKGLGIKRRGQPLAWVKEGHAWPRQE